MNLKECTLADVKMLAEMNKQLIEDENSNNPMDLIQLENRMTDFLNNGYKAFFFMIQENIIGYALCDITKTPVYLRQFFIRREERRKQYGKISFMNLLDKLETNEIDIDVLAWNEIGTKFWDSLGFKEQWKRMKFKI